MILQAEHNEGNKGLFLGRGMEKYHTAPPKLFPSQFMTLMSLLSFHLVNLLQIVI